jgi:hypothetical protein
MHVRVLRAHDCECESRRDEWTRHEAGGAHHLVSHVRASRANDNAFARLVPIYCGPLEIEMRTLKRASNGQRELRRFDNNKE